MDIYRLVYISDQSKLMKKGELAQITDQSRARNEQLGVSGMLLASGGHFIQVLEGNELRVFALYNKIAADPRHCNVRRLLAKRVTTRLFPDWGMKLADTKHSIPLDRERVDKVLIRLRLASTDAESSDALALLNEFRAQLMRQAA